MTDMTGGGREVLRDQRMEGMLEGMTGVGHRRETRRAHTQTEVGQRAGPVQRTSGLTSARMLRNHVAEFACLSPLTVNCVSYILSLETDVKSTPCVYRQIFHLQGRGWF